MPSSSRSATSKCGDATLAFLRSHVIDPQAVRADDFDGFFEKRSKALLDRIERAMGKALNR